MRSKMTAIAIAASLFAMIGAAAPTPAADGGSPAEGVLERHLEAFAVRDVDAIMADYADDAVFITPNGVLEGKDEIRSLYEQLMMDFSSPGSSVNVLRRYADGPVAYITWSGTTSTHDFRFATDTFFVEDGRIAFQTFAADIVEK